MATTSTNGSFINVVIAFYMALFSALEQTHCARMWVLHEWLAFYCAFFEHPPKWCTQSADIAGATWSCCCLGAFWLHHTAMHHDVTSGKTVYIKLNISLPFYWSIWHLRVYECVRIYARACDSARVKYASGKNLLSWVFMSSDVIRDDY